MNTNIIGNTKNIIQIKDWLKKPSKPLFISGPCGVGKTTIINKLLNKTTFLPHFIDDITIINISLIRILERQTIHEMIHRLTSKNIIIIDDVHEHSSHFKLIEKHWIKTKVPIIFISNDKYNKCMNSIKNKCLQIKLYKPYPSEIYNFINKFKLPFENGNDDVINNLIDHVDGDMRQLVTILEDLKGSNEITEKRLERYLSLCDKKDINMNIFDLTNKLFNLNLNLNLNNVLILFEHDKNMLPHSVFNNYHMVVNNIKGNNKSKLKAFKNISNNISLSDTFDYHMHVNQVWDLEEIYGITSCYIPTYHLNQYPKKYNSKKYQIKIKN
jgi:DNA polymerase III delta prime subunit